MASVDCRGCVCFNDHPINVSIVMVLVYLCTFKQIVVGMLLGPNGLDLVPFADGLSAAGQVVWKLLVVVVLMCL
jgi:hypothetical protein